MVLRSPCTDKYLTLEPVRAHAAKEIVVVDMLEAQL